MAGERARGSETFINILVDGDLVSRIDSIKDFEFTHNMDILEDEFLGEDSPRFDSMSKGTGFRISGELTNKEFFTFQQQVMDKAKRRSGSPVQIDITSTFLFTNGETYTIAFEDCAFGSMPVNTGGRSEHVSWTLEGSCSGGREVV